MLQGPDGMREEDVAIGGLAVARVQNIINTFKVIVVSYLQEC